MKIINDLAGKIKKALREPTAEELFPNLMDYLKKEYGTLVVKKIPEQTNRETWVISRVAPTIEKTIETTLVGVIRSYVKEEAAMSAEYGYEADMQIKKEKLKLKYRKGYLILDTCSGLVIRNKDPKRYDTEEVPFP